MLWRSAGALFTSQKRTLGFMICSPYQILLEWPNQEEWDGQAMWQVWETGQMRKGFWSGDLMEPIGRPRHRGDDKMKINVQEVEWRCGLDWSGSRQVAGFFWVRQWTFGFHKMRKIFWLAEDLLASQEGFAIRSWFFKFWNFQHIDLYIRRILKTFWYVGLLEYRTDPNGHAV